MMEVDGRTSSYDPKTVSNPSYKQNKPAENNAEIVWNEIRRDWIGNVSRTAEQKMKDQVISWSTTYEDLLSTHEPFPQPIPLPEMVDFLVDVWYDEGLFD